MLNNFQIERLCNIVYLDGLLNKKDTLSNIMKNLLKEGFGEQEQDLPCMMSHEEWKIIVKSITNDKELGELFIIKQKDDKITGFRAFCFGGGQEDVYVVFRGTHGVLEWQDNAIGMFDKETNAQRSALDFVKEVRAENKYIKYLCVSGHSKGGNKAQYCAVTGYELVDKCVSVDGQGFSHFFLKAYNGIIERAKEKIITIADRRDFVNCLGFYLKKPSYYSGYRGDVTEEFPYGQPLPYFHCPDALRLITGEIGKPSQKAYISETLNKFITYYLTEKKYERKREKTALGLCLLMTDEVDMKKCAEAISETALAFFELAAKDEEFRMDLNNLLIHEKDVIVATSNMVRSNHKNSGKITDTAAKFLAEKLILKPLYFHYFIKDAERFMMFSRKTNELKEHTGHISHFIKIIFKNIEKLKN